MKEVLNSVKPGPRTDVPTVVTQKLCSSRIKQSFTFIHYASDVSYHIPSFGNTG
jgi:hypothetical protein